MRLHRTWRGTCATLMILASSGLTLSVHAQGTQSDPPAKDAQPKEGPKPVRAPRPVRTPTPKPGDAKQPGDPQAAPDQKAPPTAVPTGEPKLGKIITRSEDRDALVTINIDVQAPSEARDRARPGVPPSTTLPKEEPFKFTTMGFVFPFVTSASNMDMLGSPQPWTTPGANNAPSSQTIGFRGRLTAADQVVDGEAAILTGYAAGTKLVRFDYVPKDDTAVPEVGLRLVLPVRCYATTYDEKAADAIGWPGAWPKDVASALQPQMFVEKGIDENGEIKDYEQSGMERALAAYLAEDNLNDPKAIPPARLAKLLTGKVWRDVNISGDGILRKGRASEIAGISVQAPAVTLSTKKGSAHDASVALVALMRKAGLPARTVIGVDLGYTQGKFLEDSRNKGNLRAWVEFALYDQATHTLNWVPVDIARMRKSSNRPPTRLDLPWKYFGTIDEMNAMAPIAFQYVPPTDVATYGNTAAFWGWFVTPKPPAMAEQAISFMTGPIPKTSGAPPEPGSSDPNKKEPAGKNKPKKKLGD